MTPTSFLCCVLLSSVLFAPRHADVMPQSPDPSAFPLRALVLRRSDYDTFSSEEKQKIHENQARYLRTIVSKFFRSFDDVLTVSAPEFTEIWDKYLTTLKRNDLIDQKFKNVLGDTWLRLLADHPDLSVATPLPVSVTRTHLLQTSERQLSTESPSDLNRDQLETWVDIDPGQFEQSLSLADEELSALAKLQHARYLSAQGDHVRHIFFSLNRYIDQARERGSSKRPEVLAKLFFDGLQFLRWNSPRETRLLRKLWDQRLKHGSGNPQAAIRSIEDLVATVENNDHLRQFLDRLENEAKGNPASHLERFLQLSEATEKIDLHQLQTLERYFKIYRHMNPLDPRRIVQLLRQTYYPEFNKARRLYNSAKIFSHNLGIQPGRRLQTAGRFYSDELANFHVIDANDAKHLGQLIDLVSLPPRDRRLHGANQSPLVKNLLAKFGISAKELIPIPASPSSPFLRETIRASNDPDRIGQVKLLGDVNAQVTVEVSSPKLLNRNLWGYIPSFTPRFLTTATNSVSILDNYLHLTRKIPKSYQSKIHLFPRLQHQNPLVVHVNLLSQLLKPYRAVTGLCRFRNILGRYAEHFQFPRLARKIWMKFLIAMAMRTYKATRRVRLSAMLQKFRDRSIPLTSKSRRVVAGQFVAKPKPGLAGSRFKFILGRYIDTLPIQTALKLNSRSIITLIDLIRRKRTQAKIHLALQKLVDRPPVAQASSLKILQTFKKAVDSLKLSRSSLRTILGRRIDFPMAQADTEMSLQSITKIIGHMKTRAQNQLLVALQKFQDKVLPLEKINNKIEWAIQTGLQNPVLGNKKTVLILGKSINFALPGAVTQGQIKSFLVVRPSILKRLEHQIELTLAKYADHKVRPYTVYNKVLQRIQLTLPCLRNVQPPTLELLKHSRDTFSDKQELKAKLISLLDLQEPDRIEKVSQLIDAQLEASSDSLPSLIQLYDSIAPELTDYIEHGCMATSKHLLIMGRGKDVPLAKPSVRANLMAVVESRVRNQLRQNRYFHAYLTKLRDKLLPSQNIGLKAKSQFFLNNKQTLIKYAKKMGIMQRIQEKELINPEYALALVGCFEQHYGRLSFGSWTELHTAMREYLDTVREIDSHSPAFHMIREALLHLRPFYKRGNLDYPKFFQRYQKRVTIQLSSEYEGQSIQHILEGVSDKCENREAIVKTLSDLVFYLYPQAVATQANSVLKQLNDQPQQLQDQQSNNGRPCFASAIEALEKQHEENPNLDVAWTWYQQFMGSSLSDIIQLNQLIQTGRLIFSESFESLAQFFHNHDALLRHIYGDELVGDTVFLLSTLQKTADSQKIRPKDILSLKEAEIEDGIARWFGEMQLEVVQQLTRGMQLLVALFQQVGRTYFKVEGVTYYKFDSSVAQKMAFCARNTEKITVLTSKIRDTDFRNRQQNMLVAAALQSIAKEGSLATQRFKGLSVRMRDHVLNPFFIKTFFSAYAKHFGDLKFRNYSHHFKPLFSRFIDTFVKAKMLKKNEGKALTSIFGDQKFYRNHRYKLNEILVRFVSHDVPKLATKSQATGKMVTQVRTPPGSALRANTSSGAVLGRIQNYGIYRVVDTSHLKKNLLALVPGKSAKIRVQNFLGRLQRLRLKYRDPSVAEFLRTKKFLNNGMVYQNSKGARAFYRTFNKLIVAEQRNHLNFKSDLVRLVKSMIQRSIAKGGIRRTVYKGLTDQLKKALKFYNHQVTVFGTTKKRSPENFKRLFFKYLQDDMMNRLQFRSKFSGGGLSNRLNGSRSFRKRHYKAFFSDAAVRQELKNLQKAGSRESLITRRSSIRRNRFKAGKGEMVKTLNSRSSINSGYLLRKWNLRSIRRRRFKTFLKSLQQALQIRTAPKKSMAEKKLVKALSFNRKRLKYFSAPNLIKLQFLDKVLAPEMKAKLTQGTFTKRFFLKQLESRGALFQRFTNYVRTKVAKESIFLRPALHKRFKIKTLALHVPEQQFLKFLESKYGAPFIRDVNKIKALRSQRVRVKAFEEALVKQLMRRNKTPGYTYGATLSALRDFKRLYVEAGEAGKRVKGGNTKLSFIRRVKRLINKLKKSLDIGRIKLPDINDPGKRIGRDPKIFCCGCSCTNCLVDDMCSSGPGLEECLEHQKRINSDSGFIKRAASMVNIDPVVTFYLNVKSPDGGYVENRVLRFGEDPNQTLLDELRRAEMNLMKKV